MSNFKRAEMMSEIAAELVSYAEDLIELENQRDKIEFMTECFSEVLLGLFKMHLIMNPHCDGKQLIDDFAWELEEKLAPIYEDKPKSMMN
jgi:hypothetical protein